MRASRYNVVVASAGEHLAFNAASGAVAVVDETVACVLQGADVEQLDGKDARALAEAGFLTDLSAEEELSRQRGIFRSASQDCGMLTLNLAPTYACNCRCPYCYEQDKETFKSLMPDEVVEAVFRFVEAKYAAHAFSRMNVQWYGGDPSLALEVVERISLHFLAWCKRHDVAYDAMMLSNCARIDEAAACLLARCGVSSVLVTIDGPEEVHNLRRPTAEGDNPYQRVRAAVRELQRAGIRVDAMMNLDKVNLPLYPKLKRQLAEEGVNLAPAKLNDYAHSFGTGRFAHPHFDLMTHEEFHCAQFRLFAQGFAGGEASGSSQGDPRYETGDSFGSESLLDGTAFDAEGADGALAPSSTPALAAALREMLRPVRRFCAGQLENYYVIDAYGDVYQCDGWMGDHSRRVFSLLDCADETLTGKGFLDLDGVSLNAISFDPFEDDACRVCKLLPLCWGNCSWERECCNWPCHPFKTTLPDYLTLYRRCFGPARGAVTVLAEAIA